MRGYNTPPNMLVITPEVIFTYTDSAKTKYTNEENASMIQAQKRHCFSRKLVNITLTSASSLVGISVICPSIKFNYTHCRRPKTRRLSFRITNFTFVFRRNFLLWFITSNYSIAAWAFHAIPSFKCSVRHCHITE
jgi:hypothetical protein